MNPIKYLLVLWVVIGGAFSFLPAQWLGDPPLPTDPQPLIVKHYTYVKATRLPSDLYRVDKYRPNGPVFRTEYYLDGKLFEVVSYLYNAHGDEVSYKRSYATGEVISDIPSQHFYDSEGRRIRTLRHSGENGPLETKITYQPDGGRTERVFFGDYQQHSTSYDAAGRMVGSNDKGTNTGVIYSLDEHGEVSYIRESHEEGHNVYHITNTYRPDGRLEYANQDGRRIKNCTYDKQNRLKRVEFPERNGKVVRYLEYIYEIE